MRCHRALRLPRSVLLQAVLTSFLGTALVLAAAPAQAQSPAPSTWQGVWRGTIGQAPVQVCLDRDFGAYYYLKHLKIISLGPLDRPTNSATLPVWSESPYGRTPGKGPLWRITPLNDHHLQGVWQSGSRTLPLRLQRVPVPQTSTSAGESPCGSVAFSAPRYTRPVVTTRPATLMGRAYTRVQVDPGRQFEDSSIETFQLPDDSPEIRRVNAALSRPVPRSREDAAHFACSRAALGQSGLDGAISTTLTPLILTPGWLVVQNSTSVTCGGAHPSAGVDYQTWDLRHGAVVDLYLWFTATALHRERPRPPAGTGAGTDREADAFDLPPTYTPAFRRLIEAAYPRHDADCRDAARSTTFWSPHLTARGMAFTPEMPHVVQACAEDAEIPFTRLAPSLTPAARRTFEAFLAEVRAAGGR